MGMYDIGIGSRALRVGGGKKGREGISKLVGRC